MFFDALRENKIKEFCVNDFCGINSNCENGYIADRMLFDAENIWRKDGMLKTRDGITSRQGKKLLDGDAQFSVKPAGEIVVDDKFGMQINLLKGKVGSELFVKLFAVKSDGINLCKTIRECTADNDVADIECFLFFDVPTKGNGIYALTALKHTDGSLSDKRIFEYQTESDTFVGLGADEIYAPTVYLNRKGNLFSSVKPTVTPPKAIEVEELNAVYGAYRCGFITDGSSYAFTLPYGKISSRANENIYIRYSTAEGNNVDFIINSENTESSYSTVGTKQVKAKIDRNNGVLSFVDNAGADFALPAADFTKSNLFIRVYLDEFDDSLYLMNRFESYGKHIFAYGNEEMPSVIYWSDGNQPLYFPVKSNTTVGNAAQSITRAAKQNNLLILFKSHEIHFISAVKESDYDLKALERGESINANVRQSVTVGQLNGGLGCTYPETVKLCGNRLVFLGSDKRIYALTSTAMNQKQVYTLSGCVNDKLKAMDLSQAFAVRYEGRYMLVCGTEMLLFDYNTAVFRNIASNLGSNNPDKMLGWFYWKLDNLPYQPYAAFDYDGAAFLYGYIKGYDGSFYYIKSGFSGKYDTSYLLTGTDNFQKITKNVGSEIITNKFDFGSMKKKFICATSIFLKSLVSNNLPTVTVDYISDNGRINGTGSALTVNDDGFCVITDRRKLRGTRKFGIRISSDLPVLIGDIGIKYFEQ